MNVKLPTEGSIGSDKLAGIVRRVVVVTGGARGQGLSHACAFARGGDHVVLLDKCAPIDTVPYELSTADDLRTAVSEVDACGDGEVLGFEVDVRDSSEVDDAVAAAAERFGAVDVVIANAGVFSFARHSWELDDQTWRECADTILFGSFSVARAAIPHMLDRPGANLVFIGSVNAHQGVACTAHYTAAKHGVLGLMRTLAIELAPHGVRANMVSPTATRTTMATNDAMQLAFEYQRSAGSDMKNLLDVDLLDVSDVTEAVMWISSSAARYVTGTTLTVDAGFGVR